jgi:transposase-like protein
MDGVFEIITGRERRRRWSFEDKRRIVKESTERGAVMRAVAARNGICESLLYAWRRQMRGIPPAATAWPRAARLLK